MALFRGEAIENRQTRLHGDLVLTQPTSYWLMISLIMSFVAFVGIWLFLANYSRSEIVAGRVISRGPLVKILPSRAGVITALHALDGQAVRQGQPLMTVVVAQRSERVADPSTAESNTLTNQAKLVDEKIGLTLRAESDEAEKLRSQLVSYTGQLTALQEQEAIQQQILESNRRSFDPLTTVMQRGFVSRYQYETRRQAVLASEEQLTQIHESQAQIRGQITQIKDDIKNNATQYRLRRNESASEKSLITEKLIANDVAKSYVITAPISGIVSNTQVTVGSSVSTQAPLMAIIGASKELEVEAYATSKATGFLKTGQEVIIKYDAFPSDSFGVFKGKIEQISRNALSPTEVDAAIPVKEPVYRIRVAILNQAIDAYGARYNLKPGMTLTARIILEKRSLFQWFIDPVRALSKA